MTVAAPAPSDDDHARKASLIGEFRRIVAAKQGAWIGDVAVDRFSAAQVLAMHDRLSPEARELYTRQGAERMLQLAYAELRRDLQARSRRR